MAQAQAAVVLGKKTGIVGTAMLEAVSHQAHQAANFCLAAATVRSVESNNSAHCRGALPRFRESPRSRARTDPRGTRIKQEVWLKVLVVWLLCVSVALPATSVERIAARVLEMTNDARVKKGLMPLRSDEHLTAAAQRHCQNMCKSDFFDHVSPVAGETEVEDRVARAGGAFGSFSENLYWSRGLRENQLPNSIYREWMDSPDHRDAMLGPENVSVGIGVFRKGSEYWATAVFSDS